MWSRCALQIGRQIIAGGTKIKRFDKYPFEVAIIDVKSDITYCGGMIISSKFILTAAHCITKEMAKTKSICHTRNMPKKCFKPPKTIKIGYINHPTKDVMHKMEVLRIIPHPHHNAKTYTNDIALIELKTPIVCLDLPRPICLPAKNLSKVGNELIIVGWRYSEVEELSGQSALTEGKVVQVPSSNCSYIEIPTNRIVCARGIKSKQASCQGNSGSGILILHDMNYYVLGVTSIGPVNCKSGLPNAYTDVYANIDWIKSVVKDLPTI
ncbi:vitamin K-dependent protein C [Trichonephila clavata]|uniref:Vitamin K-dependent protein C n=1 Tax=Trichonephila clavata TaxID=2740835 RepID=A0A8X6HIC0_TRICU|nr:vitamin K-dependent protein C [Trichonephila clavata]